MEEIFHNFFRAILALSIVSLSLSSVSLNAQNYCDVPNSQEYLSGVQAFNANDFNKAFDCFTEELNVHPDNGFAWFYIGEIHISKNEWESAETAFENACQLIPREEYDLLVKSYCNCGCSKMSLSKWGEAENIFDKEVSLAILSAEDKLLCRAYLDRASFTTIATFYTQDFLWDVMFTYIERDLNSALEYFPNHDQMYKWFSNIINLASLTENYSEALARDYTKIREVTASKSSDAANGINDAWKEFVAKGKGNTNPKAEEKKQNSQKEQQIKVKETTRVEEVLTYSIPYSIVKGKHQVTCSFNGSKQQAFISNNVKGIKVSPFIADILSKRGAIKADGQISEGMQFTVKNFFIGNVSFGTVTITISSTCSLPIEVGENVLTKLGTVKKNSSTSCIEIYTKK